MDNLALLFTLIFVALAMLLSFWYKVGLEKSIIIGTIRAAIQLIAIGYVLHAVFSLENWLLVVFIIGVMIFVATLNSSTKWNNLKGIKWRIALALIITETITMGIMLLLRIIDINAENIIPISGMIIGNGMVNASLFLNRLKSEFETRREEVNLLLSLGANSKQAFREIRRDTVRASMIPIIDNLKTVGLVQLPGMMTGMIIAGANPIDAVRYQLLIMYALVSSAALVSIIIALLVHRLLFNRSHQMIAP